MFTVFRCNNHRLRKQYSFSAFLKLRGYGQMLCKSLLISNNELLRCFA